MMNDQDNLMAEIVALAKRRGFVYPGSEIYGGLANTWDYGPLGAQLLKNIRDLWWRKFVTDREDIYPIESGILMSPRVWEASGHTKAFHDIQVDCRHCQMRTRADHLIEDYFEDKGEEMKVEGMALSDLAGLIEKHHIGCPNCGAFDWASPRRFNLLFETHIGIVPETQSLAYLRGETAQGMFVNFKQVLDSANPKLPFGIAQIGKSFRNEITKGRFTFRTLEFEHAELEYFFNPKEQDWQELYDFWKGVIWEFVTKTLGVSEESLRWRVHTDQERSHYSKRTEDLDYHFPFGWKELWGHAYRTDYDLTQHMKESGVDLRYTDPETGEKFIPHVVEPAVGINRLMLTILVDGYVQKKDRAILKLRPHLAPYTLAVFPLLANKPQLIDKARQVYTQLRRHYRVAWDDRGNIGKRYYAQDEIGTPWCLTIDFQTLDDDTVTVRDRDTTNQERIEVAGLGQFFENQLR